MRSGSFAAAVARRVVGTASLLAIATAAAGAQALPDAKELIARWAKESNAAGWKGHKTARSSAAFDLPAMGLSAKMEMAQGFEPSRSVTRIDIPAMGEMRQGFDGSVAWQSNPMQGPSLITGPQLDATREESHPDNYSRQTASIVSSETVEKTTLNDTECYKVKHTWKSGRVSHDCFGVADGMIVWTQTKVPTQMGEIEVTTTFAGYKDFGGVKRPTTTTIDQAGSMIIITLQSWEWDTVDPKEFELPPDIKALVEKKP
jgi:hypothetical protein